MTPFLICFLFLNIIWGIREDPPSVLFTKVYHILKLMSVIWFVCLKDFLAHLYPRPARACWAHVERLMTGSCSSEAKRLFCSLFSLHIGELSEFTKHLGEISARTLSLMVEKITTELEIVFLRLEAEDVFVLFMGHYSYSLRNNTGGYLFFVCFVYKLNSSPQTGLSCWNQSESLQRTIREDCITWDRNWHEGESRQLVLPSL